MTIAENFGARHRSIADKMLAKTLTIGLGGSMLLHSIAIAGVNYWQQNDDNNLEITAIERVEVDPEPAPVPTAKPIVPLAKPAPTVVKPPLTAAVPRPISVKISTPKIIPTPTPVVKITKSAIKLQSPTSSLANFTALDRDRALKPTPLAKTAPIAPPQSTPPPSFPDKLFTTPVPKPQRTQIATRKIDKIPPKSAPLQQPQPTTSNNQTALAASQPTKLAPTPSPAPVDNPATNDELIPRSPGNPSKLARSPDRSPPGNNQTSLTNQPQSSPGWSGDLGLPDTNPPAASDDFASTPGNNTRIAKNATTPPATTNNQTGLATNPTNRSGINPNFGNSSGDRNPAGNEDSIGGTPGNNTRIAQSNSGSNGGKDRANVGGSPPIGGGNNGNGKGTPGNIATGSRNQVSIQCLRNCEIRYPDELENSDLGKDKILVKVTIDANGMVSAAEIARSSGNQKLDRVTLAGVKQMQLNPTGKIQTFRVNINTLANN